MTRAIIVTENDAEDDAWRAEMLSSGISAEEIESVIGSQESRYQNSSNQRAYSGPKGDGFITQEMLDAAENVGAYNAEGEDAIALKDASPLTEDENLIGG